MLPIRLTLRNFLPYHAPDPIIFEGLHLAVLSGPNGAGKSALLDAITWALWGRARGRTDQDLITLGADEMRVELEFEQEGERYLVARWRDRRRRQTSLSLYLRDDAAPGGLRDISAPTLRETQARITGLLRLDYDTFVHSAFLQQGRADAFTTRPPAQRRQILADILGLGVWESWAEQARNRLREIEGALQNIDGRLSEIADELARQPMLERDLAAAETDHAATAAALHEAEAAYDAIRDAPAQLRAALDRQADLDRRLRAYAHDEGALLAEVERLAARVADYRAIIARREVIETGFATLEAARQADRSLGDKLLSLQEAEERRHALERQIAAARAELEAQASDYRGAIEELSRLAVDADSIAAEMDEVEAEIAALQAREAERDALRQTIASLKEEAAALRGANDALRREMGQIKARLDTLSAADPDAAECPTCQQPLPPPRRAELIAAFRADGTARGDRYRANAARLQAIQAELARHDATMQTLLAGLSRLNTLRQRAGELRARLEAARDAGQRLQAARDALAGVEAILAAENYAGEARAQLALLQEEIAALGYDRSAHAAAREDLTAYRAYERQQHELQAALDALPAAEEALAAAEERLARLRQRRAEDEAARAASDAEIERLQALATEANRRFDHARAVRTAFQAAAEKRARAQQALHALAAARQRQETLQARRAALAGQGSLYAELREAFGGSGIPAMIIEAAIPELEDTANELLARMTDGRMRLQITTQREKVSGGQIDTLDIVIADEQGTRDYALYSGGEAFRIDFALRVALSKLLARRAGAHLRTLFIDEGFGTQDAAGRERLVSAINAVADDFDLILVITHLDDLRDAFPARLEVERTAAGSRVRIA